MERYYAPYLLPLSDDRPEAIRDGAVDVSEGRITWAGPASEAPEPAAGEELREHRLQGLLMPGFVNAHAHTPMTLLRGLGEGLPVDEWLPMIWKEEAKLTPELVETGMLAGGAELLAGGVTTSAEMYFYPDSIARASAALGMRAMVTPPLLAEMTLPGLETWPRQWEQFLAFEEQWGEHPTVMAGIGPHAVYSVPDEALRALAEYCAPKGVLAHIHLAEQEQEDGPVRERTGMSATAYLQSVGLWDGPALAAHGVWLSDRDISTLAEHDVSVAHCPCSNAKHASGVIRLSELQAAGVNVSIATDGPASHNRLDMFEEMRTAIRLQRAHHRNAELLPPAQALRMAAANGARALGRSDLGRLAAGFQADMININLDHRSFLPHTEEYDAASRLVWSGSPEAVKHVWVGGTQVVRDGALTRVDQKEAAERLNAAARALLQ